MKIWISERRGKRLLGAIAKAIGQLRAGHLCGVILAAGLVACSTTPGTLVDARSEVFSPVISKNGDPQTVAVFVNWHQGCVFGECDTPEVELQNQAAACIQSGLRRVNPDVRAIPGPGQLPQDTSALVADPREKGHPDLRFDADLVSKLRKEGIQYAVILDVYRTLGTSAQETELELIDTQVPSAIVRRKSRRSVRVRAEAILIELDSRRWLARIRRDFRDYRDHAASFVLLKFLYPIPRFLEFEATRSTAGLSACEKVGEGLGNVLSGQQGLARLETKGTFVTCKSSPQVSRRIAAGQCSGDQCPVLAELCY